MRAAEKPPKAANGHIELRVGIVDEQLRITEELVIPHAVLVAGLTEPSGVDIGGNLALVWVDERHGNGVLDPHPEIVFEVVWY